MSDNKSENEKKVNLDEVYDRVIQFMNDLKPPAIHEYKQDYKIIIPFKYTFPNNETITLNVDTRLGNKWIEIKCFLLSQKSLPKTPDLEFLLHKKLLQANFNFAEVCYSLDDDGNIFAEADMPVDTDFVNFKSEFVSIVFAIEQIYQKIIPSVSEEIRKDDTYKKAMYT